MVIKLSLYFHVGFHQIGQCTQASLVSRDRIVVSTSRCGRDNPGSNPGHGKALVAFMASGWHNFFHFIFCTFIHRVYSDVYKF